MQSADQAVLYPMSTPPPDAAHHALEPVKPPTTELLIVTGMSGAGRSTAANALEDLSLIHI